MSYQQKTRSLTPLIESIGMSRFLQIADRTMPLPEVNGRPVDPLQILKECSRLMLAGNSDDRGNLTGNPFRRGY